MGCIRVEKITEYLCEPLSRCLRDEDPYVRKTAAVCVAKLYDISPELVEDRGFVDNLRELISDANPTVVANAVSALSEISETSGKDAMNVSANVLQKFKNFGGDPDFIFFGEVSILLHALWLVGFPALKISPNFAMRENEFRKTVLIENIQAFK